MLLHNDNIYGDTFIGKVGEIRLCYKEVWFGTSNKSNLSHNPGKKQMGARGIIIYNMLSVIDYMNH